MKLNRWTYMIVVAIVAVAAGVAMESRGIAALGLALLLPVLTFPLGVVGAFCALPLIYSGIATPSEAHVIAAPAYALAGMFQWYVLLPRWIARRSTLQVNLNAVPHAGHLQR